MVCKLKLCFFFNLSKDKIINNKMENLLTFNIMSEFTYGFFIGSVCILSTLSGILVINSVYFKKNTDVESNLPGGNNIIVNSPVPSSNKIGRAHV